MSRSLFFQKPFSYKFFNATLYLIGINLVVFLLTMRFPVWMNYLSLCPVLVVYYKMFWQFFTYMFVHGSLQHLLFNMLALFCFGIQLEKALGSKEFLLFYFVCGIFSGLCSFGMYMFTGQYRIFLLGASGATYALLLAYAVVFPRNIICIWGLIPVPAPILVLAYALIEIITEVFGSRTGTAHLAHLFGFLGALLYFPIRMRVNPFRIWKNS
ncbi:MAG: rhomboid family intramembrane serine protease [Treponema sp.]|nr:rhomboid family intramembrane serine protease [Treponema sp.]